MEQDTKSKHRISDARWRDSVSRCYNLLKQCTHAGQDLTRSNTLHLTLDLIQSYEKQIEELGYLEMVQAIFGHGEELAMQQQQEQQQQQDLNKS